MWTNQVRNSTLFGLEIAITLTRLYFMERRIHTSLNSSDSQFSKSRKERRISMPFSAQSMVYARKSVSPDAAGQAFFNFRVPTHLCFAIAIVDELDPEIRTAIQTTNPFDLRVDMLWYEIPVIYELSQQQLYFYDQPTNLLEQFKGEIVWKHLRLIIQQILGVPYK
jgi:hypothetical protein